MLEDPLQLPRWWPSVYLNVKEIAPGDPVTHEGRVIDLYTKGWLPYTLRWRFTVTDSRAPKASVSPPRATSSAPGSGLSCRKASSPAWHTTGGSLPPSLCSAWAPRCSDPFSGRITVGRWRVERRAWTSSSAGGVPKQTTSAARCLPRLGRPSRSVGHSLPALAEGLSNGVCFASEECHSLTANPPKPCAPRSEPCFEAGVRPHAGP